jgi:RNA-directed DNA polymerase
VISPLLSNLVLDELDRELELRGHCHVRYADDCNVYVRSEQAGRRVMESITRFITHKLKLKVNESKSAVARPQERKFLGFSFTAGPELKRVIAPKALERFKRRIREITRRAKGVSIQTTIKELASYIRGWRSYFGFCETPEVLDYLTRWVRLRLRAALWRQWKTPRRRRAALLALGVRPRLASNTAGSGRGPWYLAKSKALSVGLSNAYFESLGLPTLIDGC